MTQQIGTNLREAVREALEKCEQWQGGAVVVRFMDNSYDAIPPAYLNDISYGNRNEIDEEIWDIQSISDLGEWDGPVTDDLVDAVINLINANY